MKNYLPACFLLICLCTWSSAQADWIDLGDEGRTLWVSARLTTPELGQTCDLVLATSNKMHRVGLGVDEKGRYRLWLFGHTAVGETCTPGQTVTVVAKLVCHSQAPDEGFLRVYDDVAELPQELPSEEVAWTVVNRRGNSAANLARVMVAPASAKGKISQVRVGDSWEAICSGPVLDKSLACSELLEADVVLDLSPPDPINNPDSALMLDLPDAGTDPARIDFAGLPKILAEPIVVSDVRDRGGNWVHQHVYLAHHGGKYWFMWSDGPGVRNMNLTPEEHRNVVPGHDQADTRVSYATSDDGLHWSKPKDLSGPPRAEGFGWIARGFWQRNGELLALASHFHAPGYAGKGLSLEAFRWDDTHNKWVVHGTVLDDTLNNFPPKKLPNGLWMMSRRDSQRHVTVMVGGVEAIDKWTIQPLARYEGRYRPEEPYWYVLPDGKSLVGLFRDNGGSKRLLRAYSTDNGRSWSRLVVTNYPDATSKFNALRTSRGYYAMVSNANPRDRNPLVLSISRDGLVYTHMFYLVGGRHVDYPHMIEHDGKLLIAFSGAKQTAEVLSVPLDEIDALLK